MNDNDIKLASLFVGGFICFFFLRLIGGIYEYESESADMKECVSHGGSWVRTADAPYYMECRKI